MVRFNGISTCVVAPPLRFDLRPIPVPRFLAALAAHWRVGLLVVVTTAIWAVHYDRLTLASWSLPTDYRGDSLEILARIKAASEGDTVPLTPQIITRLGAPFGANWSAYPSSDLLLMWLLGRIAAVVGVFAAANFGLLLGTVTSAVSFYGCARWLRARWEWAFAGALLFAFTYQPFHRGLAHLFFVFSWTVPIAILSSGIIASSRRLEWHGRMGWFCIGSAAAIGIGNPYVLMLYLQLVGWAVIAQWLGQRRRENIIAGLVAIGVAVACFFIVEAHVWLFSADRAAASPIVRNYGGTERYALKPIELLLPPDTHRWDALAFFGHRYLRWSDWRSGEAFAPYLGLVGIAALGWLVIVATRAVLRRQRLPGATLPLLWVLAFASVGGVTNMLAFFTTVNVFRATNRFSVFISALVLLFLVTRLSRWRPRLAGAGFAAALLMASIGLWDEIPPPISAEKQHHIAARVDADIDLGKRLEHDLPPGAMVFQLPVMGFPEVVPPFQMTDYEPFRPYIGTHSLRFTYGMLKAQSPGEWQREIAALPTPTLVKQLEQLGFSAVYINREGFADRGEKVLAALAAAGYHEMVSGNLNEQVVVRLRPGAHPVKPLARNLTFGTGWHEARPGNPRWAYGPATLSFLNSTGRPLPCQLRLTLSSVDARHVVIEVNGTKALETTADGTQRELQIPVTLPPGVSEVDLASPEPPLRLSFGQDQLRAFAVYKATVDPDEDLAQMPEM